MADNQPINPKNQPWQHSVDEARAFARERFKERLENGEQVGDCSCHTEHEAVTALGGESAQVVGVRFRDSSRIYFYSVDERDIENGDWVVVRSSRGFEAARVVIAPRQMLVNQLNGELHPIERRMTEDDVIAMESRRGRTAEVVRTAGACARKIGCRLKVVAAEFSFDGSLLRISYATTDQQHSRSNELKVMLESEFGMDIEMAQVGPRDEARLVGGLGKCGRTLCCASWLPFYPDVSMGMAKTQDLGLNPSKVTGLCGRLLCCLSYENEQYRQAKRILPRLGNTVTTEHGMGTVISLQVLKELVTVRMDNSPEVKTIPAAEVLGEPNGRRPDAQNFADGSDAAQGDDRRRRRNRRP
jgi:cell fate regulator YaaT (PSP1 superfamily)